jgi:dynein heavy chain
MTEIQLKPPFNLKEVRALFRNEATPVQIVLIQGLDHWNPLASSMWWSLLELQKVIRGAVSMSKEAESVRNAAGLGEAGAGDREGTRRLAGPRPEAVQAVGGLVQEPGAEDDLAPGLHVPKAYLAGLLQTGCRSEGWPLDKATLIIFVPAYQRGNQMMIKPAPGCCISRDYLEGAFWDLERKCLIPHTHRISSLTCRS